MSIESFDRLTPAEFQAVYDNWRRYGIQEYWERSRFIACSMLQPWSSKALKVTDICRFDWDDPDKGKKKETRSTRERFEIMKRKAKMD